MKKFKLFVLMIIIIFVFSACKANNDKSIDTNNTKTVITTTPIPTNIPTVIPTITLIPTSKPELTGKEKSNILYKLGKEYKTNHSTSLNRDEFDNSVSITIPSTSSSSSIEGDNSEIIKVMPYIYYSSKDEDDIGISLLFHCVHENLSFPQDVYIKSSKNEMTFKLTTFDPDIEVGYVIESGVYEFKDINKMLKFKKIIKSKSEVRIRLSGKDGDDIDFTLNSKFKKYLLDGIDLYLKANKLCNEN